MKELINKLHYTIVTLELLAEYPGYNGSVLMIDDTDRDQIVRDLSELCSKLEEEHQNV